MVEWAAAPSGVGRGRRRRRRLYRVIRFRGVRGGETLREREAHVVRTSSAPSNWRSQSFLHSFMPCPPLCHASLPTEMSALVRPRTHTPPCPLASKWRFSFLLFSSSRLGLK
ncbi:hypothetical protein CEXT_182391 [Caerostris extrusa]|uniref:Uncharacterized protein n=1 Tax=Caerostris extrusa TaxID=172846 RepID=A0AAV4MDR3_CAEEX|nr:hypothetical protein CEXT_182391 [Caerostris extrusa]